MVKKAKKKKLQDITHEQAQAASAEYAACKNELEELEVKMNGKINKVKDDYAEAIIVLSEKCTDSAAVLEQYAKEQRASWGKRKSLEMLHTFLRFRTAPPSVGKSKKFTWEAVVELLKKNNSLSQFLRTKEEVDKTAILATKDAEILASLKECFITISSKEEFYIDIKKEEVATV
ncbi:host-nuclease inhibitor Gam family protein [Chitinophaga pendula]|uniref:host-nuclease inhibitor Gam family protein n=1 Tax=Chitinophaga TaxID=79328 RepID=UPI000BAF6665|nr:MULTISPECIES: host-nuclease inhibitor Gam family protein [Chitinophaga]ASZ11077.1 hypothetical protein CK934_08945 [Chitinophaga sp. MD30]UCJ05925.1 host-nuclease inhibitor Gam family protein [Chitinophaga pendula]